MKLFAVGFFITTWQASVFEQILELLLLVVVSPYISDAVDDKGVQEDQDGSDSSGSGGGKGFLLGSTSSTRSVHGRMMSLLFNAFNSPTALKVTNAFRETPSHYSAETYTSAAAYTFGAHGADTTSMSMSGMAAVDLSASEEGDAQDTAKNIVGEVDVGALIRDNWGLVFFGCFLMAFVVAAGVEETMKHFIVRCYRFGSPLKDPYTITIFLLAGALGFTTAENIGYVFGSKDSPLEGESKVVGEITVLLLRVCMPIHLFCAVFQACNVCRLIMGQAPDMSLFKVLLPGLILHGLFDFSLFVLSIIAFAENIDSDWYEFFCLAVALVIGVIGGHMAYNDWKKVVVDYEHGFQQLRLDESQHTSDHEMELTQL